MNVKAKTTPKSLNKEMENTDGKFEIMFSTFGFQSIY